MTKKTSVLLNGRKQLRLNRKGYRIVSIKTKATILP
jgi:hypothetical protein